MYTISILYIYSKVMMSDDGNRGNRGSNGGGTHRSCTCKSIAFARSFHNFSVLVPLPLPLPLPLPILVLSRVLDSSALENLPYTKEAEPFNRCWNPGSKSDLAQRGRREARSTTRPSVRVGVRSRVRSIATVAVLGRRERSVSSEEEGGRSCASAWVDA